MISEAEPIGVRSRHCGSSYIVCFFVCFNKKMLKPELPSSSYICFLITVVLIGTFAILGFIHSLQQASKLCCRVCMWDFRQCMFFCFSQWSFKLNFRHVCNLWSAWLSQSCQNEMDTEHPIHETQLGPVSKVTNMEYIAAKTRNCLKIDGAQRAATVQWLLVNGKKKYMREIVSDNHKCKWDSCCVWTWSKNIFLCSLFFWKARHWYSGFHRSYSSSWYKNSV